MADEKKKSENESMYEEITFCVSVNLRIGDTKTTVVQNSIRKFLYQDTWFDIFVTTENDDSIPKCCFDNFEKLSSITVSSKPTGSGIEQYSPNAYDKISVLIDFDKKLKYVTINITDPSKDAEQSTSSATSGTQNAFSILNGDWQPEKNIFQIRYQRKRNASQGCPNAMLTGQNVRSTVLCYECGKPRCLYSKKVLNARDEKGLKRLLEKYNYSCGAMITPDGDPLQGKIFVRLQLGCTSPIKKTYYSSHLPVNTDLCFYCGTDENTSRDEEALADYRVVFPICGTCKARGRVIVKRLLKK